MATGAVGTYTPEGDKGLKSGALGMLSSVVIGVASTAPAYSLAVSLGLVAAIGGMGVKSPAIMIAAFIPMLFIAGAYYYLNKADPDCGTTFMWTTRAFGPHVGWVTGWVMVAADIIVMASLAQITGSYFFLLFGAEGLAASVFWVTAVGVIFLVLMTIITALGIELAAEIQWGLLGMEFVILVVFSVVALVRVFGGSPPVGSIHPSWGWFSPFGMSLTSLRDGVLIALFIYWGWDTAVAVNEETEAKNKVPGLAAVISTLALVAIYTMTTAAAQAMHGGQFLADNASDVLSPLGADVLGSTVSKLLLFAVLTSSAASTMTTILPGSRTMLSMSKHGAIPAAFARIHTKYKTPVFSTIVYGVLSIAFYVGLTLVSQNVLADSIAALGLTIAFYYGINGFAAPWLYRKTLFSDIKRLLLIGVFPILGALLMFYVLIQSMMDLYDPANSASGSSWLGIGPPFIIGLGFFVSGVVAMLIATRFAPDFFQRRRETVETMLLDTYTGDLHEGEAPAPAEHPGATAHPGATEPILEPVLAEE